MGCGVDREDCGMDEGKTPVDERFAVRSRRLATAQILLSLLLIVLEAAGLGFGFNHIDTLTGVWAGIWAGLFFLATGLVGWSTSLPRSAKSPSGRGRFIAWLLLSIFSILLATALLCYSLFEAITANTRDSRYLTIHWDSQTNDMMKSIAQGLRIISTVAYFGQIVLFGISAVYASVQLCCRQNHTDATDTTTEHAMRFRRGIRGLAITELILAILIIALEIPGAVRPIYHNDMLLNVYAGIWSGIIFVGIAIGGLVITRSKTVNSSTKKSCLVFYTIFATLAFVLSLALFIAGIVTLVLFICKSKSHYEYLYAENGVRLFMYAYDPETPPKTAWAMRGASQLLYGVEAILFCISTCFAGSNVCCPRKVNLFVEQVMRFRQEGRGLAIAEIALTVPLIALEVTGLALGLYVSNVTNRMGAGIWSSVLFIVTGVVGLLAARVIARKQSGGRFIASMVLSSLSALLAAILFSVSVYVAVNMEPTLGPDYERLRTEDGLDMYALRNRENRDHIPLRLFPILALFIYFAEFVLFSISAVFGGANVCCRQGGGARGILIQHGPGNDHGGKIFHEPKLLSTLKYIDDPVFEDDHQSTNRLIKR